MLNCDANGRVGNAGCSDKGFATTCVGYLSGSSSATYQVAYSSSSLFALALAFPSNLALASFFSNAFDLASELPSTNESAKSCIQRDVVQTRIQMLQPQANA